MRPGSRLGLVICDGSGTLTFRKPAEGFAIPRFGAACPLWNAHQAFEMPGRINRQLAETPDGVRYLCLATQVSKGSVKPLSTGA